MKNTHFADESENETRDVLGFLTLLSYKQGKRDAFKALYETLKDIQSKEPDIDLDVIIQFIKRLYVRLECEVDDFSTKDKVLH